MGTFLSTLGNITIADADRDEFREMYMKVATAGGMMEVEEIKIFDKNFELLTPLKIEKDGRVIISYNYFEDIWWEPGCFDYEAGKVYNNKVGWREYNIVSSALQLLSEFHCSTEGYASGERVLSLSMLTAWLNYVLGSRYHLKKRRDALHIYEMLKEKHQEVTMDDLCDELEPYGVCSHYELLSRIFTEMPVDEAVKFFEDGDSSQQSRRFVFSPKVRISAAKETIQEWLERDMPIEEQLPDIKKFLARAADFIVLDETGWLDKNKDLPYADNFAVMYMLGMDVFVKIFLHETGIADEELEKYAAAPLKIKKHNWMLEDSIPLPITTQDILCYREPDNMAYWWHPDGDVILSDDFWVIFYSFKLRYQDIREKLAKEELLDGLGLMRKLSDIGAACEETFRLPIIFADFFYEMTSNSQSLDNQALVELLDNYVKVYSVQYQEEKENSQVYSLMNVGTRQSYKMLKKLSAILANKNLRQHLQEI